ncbi:MAG: hypothetical protein JSS56_27825 [Proteobacteria bacterium]|nr:hypothetical protein [Pseudomonadota bacterium]
MKRLLAALSVLALCAGMGQPPASGTITVTYGGVARQVIVHTPNGKPPARPMGLVVAFHGNHGDGAGMERITALDDQADEHGFIVAYPSAIGGTWDLSSASADPGFGAAVIRQLAATYKILSVTLAGYSLGGGMAEQVIACNPGLAQALAVVAENMTAWKVCGQLRPVPTVWFHGTEDPVSTYDPSVIAAWQKLQGAVPFTPYTGPWGHTWPGGTQASGGQLGVVAASPVASAVVAGMVR